MRWVAKAIIIVGTSGWQYRDWRGYFYPSDLAQRAWLGFYAERFGIVEVNNSFYRLPERDTFNRWRGGTPDDFRFAVKASRYLTHIRRLPEPAEPVRRLLEHSDGPGRQARADPAAAFAQPAVRPGRPAGRVGRVPAARPGRRRAAARVVVDGRGASGPDRPRRRPLLGRSRADAAALAGAARRRGAAVTRAGLSGTPVGTRSG